MNNFTVDTLREFLNSHGIDTSGWGQGITKSLDRLLGEINEGECEVAINDDGKAKRVLETCSVDIYYKDDNGTIWKLREQKQVLSSGTVKELTDTESIRGKMKSEENPGQAIKREIKEEIGVSDSGYDELKFLETKMHIGMPTTFPGLLSHYTQHHFETYLHKECFNPDGYIEKQPDKTIYFVWEKLGE